MDEAATADGPSRDDATRRTTSWPARPESVPAARRWVRGQLREAGLPGLAEDAALLVTELVTNVVLHVGGQVGVSMILRPGEVELQVRDSSPLVPRLRAFSPQAQTGRGMRLLQALAAEHGVRADPAGAGKVLWARLVSGGGLPGDRPDSTEVADGDGTAEDRRLAQLFEGADFGLGTGPGAGDAAGTMRGRAARGARVRRWAA